MGYCAVILSAVVQIPVKGGYIRDKKGDYYRAY